MNKIIITLMAIYFVGDPHLQYLSWLGELKLYVVAPPSHWSPCPGSPNSSTGNALSVAVPTPSLRTAASGSPFFDVVPEIIFGIHVACADTSHDA